MAKKATKTSTRKKPAKAAAKKADAAPDPAALDASLKENAAKLEELAAASGTATETQEVSGEDVGDAAAVLGDQADAPAEEAVEVAPAEAPPPEEDVQVMPSDEGDNADIGYLPDGTS